MTVEELVGRLVAANGGVHSPAAKMLERFSLGSAVSDALRAMPPEKLNALPVPEQEGVNLFGYDPAGNVVLK